MLTCGGRICAAQSKKLFEKENDLQPSILLFLYWISIEPIDVPGADIGI